MSTIASIEKRIIPTYGLGKPETNPLFFEKRVYQGSCGKVYPLPFIDKVYQDNPPEPVEYQSVRLENEYIRLVMLPEIGGRIFIGQDKTNGDYDFFYRQDVIKPALVGLAGPWISGGVEFNWPQHHRPGTYLPADFTIEDEGDGIYTVWMSEHDPLNRLKGMHGIRIRPGSMLVELRARLFNRTPFTQTFLWWANVAARVHENYQSFFPPDVHYVADHAVRAMSSFPVANNNYYGVDYANRPGSNDISWYRNIPVPTSYMVCQSAFNFFGGYDYDSQGGFVHVADRHISPGKKQWTWGNHPFGYAWDKELTDSNGPYIELMAGVYTDNQPDFSYLMPYESKSFTQCWWPYQKLGPVQEANEQAVIRLVVLDNRRMDLGLATSRAMDHLRIVLKHHDRILLEEVISVRPDSPWQNKSLVFAGEDETALCLLVFNSEDKPLIGYRPVDTSRLERKRDLATEPPMPAAISSSDELYLTGEHLEQNRHPTRYPELYWEEGLRRDPLDSRCNVAMGRQKLLRGQFAAAAGHFRSAIKRLTFRHPNPETGEAHYFLGLTLVYKGNPDEAYSNLYKATWNYAWRAAAFFDLACIDMCNARFDKAITHLEASLESNTANNKAVTAIAICLRKLARLPEAAAILDDLLKVDPLDHWALAEHSSISDGTSRLSPLSRNDAQTVIDVAFDYAKCGCFQDAIDLISCHHREPVLPVAVPNPQERSQLTHYTLAWLYHKSGDRERSEAALLHARSLTPDYCFPSRLEEMIVLEWALEQPGPDRNAAYGLGNLYYDRKRRHDAVDAWINASEADPEFATVQRNLGIAFWNVEQNAMRARECYELALENDPADSRLVAEYSQLCGKTGDSVHARLAFLEGRVDLVLERDDATVELATLYNATNQPLMALDLLLSRRFHPWEGGEGKVLRQYTNARLLLGQKCLEAGDAVSALEHFDRALETPEQLGEKYHFLQAKADVTYWQGKALRALGREDEARDRFSNAATESGDFQQMASVEFSELTCYKALALRELGREDEAREILKAIAAYTREEMNKPAKIDYFATSLPNLLVFEEDLQETRRRQMQALLDLAVSLM